MTTVIDDNEIADQIRTNVMASTATLTDENVTPGLATVLVSDDGTSETYVSMKQQARIE
jgi:methylenetetrahydrofolate dehydrogenase (NADP+)/methenyltetrahydrofolate cyclohydrolase